MIPDECFEIQDFVGIELKVTLARRVIFLLARVASSPQVDMP